MSTLPEWLTEAGYVELGPDDIVRKSDRYLNSDYFSCLAQLGFVNDHRVGVRYGDAKTQLMPSTQTAQMVVPLKEHQIYVRLKGGTLPGNAHYATPLTLP